MSFFAQAAKNRLSLNSYSFLFNGSFADLGTDNGAGFSSISPTALTSGSSPAVGASVLG